MRIKKFWSGKLPSVQDALVECTVDYNESKVPVKFKQLWQTYVVVFTDAYSRLLNRDPGRFWIQVRTNVLNISKLSSKEIGEKTVDHCLDYLKFHLIAMYCCFVYLKSPATEYTAWYQTFLEAEKLHLSPRVVRKLNELQWSIYSMSGLHRKIEQYRLQQIERPILASDPDFMFLPLSEQKSFTVHKVNGNFDVYSVNNDKPLWTVQQITDASSLTHHRVIAQQDFKFNEVLAVVDPSAYLQDIKEEKPPSDKVYHQLPVLFRRWSFLCDNRSMSSAYIAHYHRADLIADTGISDDTEAKGSLLMLADDSHFFGHKNMPLREYNVKMSGSGVFYVTDPNGIKKGQEIVIRRRSQLAWNCTEDAIRKYIHRYCDDNRKIDREFFLLDAILQRKECRADVNFNVSSVGNINPKSTFYSPISFMENSRWLYDMFFQTIDTVLDNIPEQVAIVKRSVFHPFVKATNTDLEKWSMTPDQEQFLEKYTEQQQKTEKLLAAGERVKLADDKDLSIVAGYVKNKFVCSRLPASVTPAFAQTNPVSLCEWKDLSVGPFFIMEGFDKIPAYIMQQFPGSNSKILQGVENYIEEYEKLKQRGTMPLMEVVEDEELIFCNIDGCFYDLPLFHELHEKDGKTVVVFRSSFYRKKNTYILYQKHLN